MLLGSAPVSAGPTEPLREFFDAVNVILADPEIADKPLERIRRVRPLVREVSDVHEAAAVALEREWPALRPAEQEEFVTLFAELLQRAYIGQLAGRGRVADGVRVMYLNESVGGDEATVQTALGAREGGEVLVEYRMVKREGRWRVRDLVLDGVSTVENYRAQFRRLLRQGTYPDLVAQVRAKLAEEAIIFAPAEGRIASAPARRLAPLQIVQVDAASTDGERAPEIVPATAMGGDRLAARPAGTIRSRDVGWKVDAATARATVEAGVVPARSAVPALRYWVQVGAFKTPATAARFAERLHDVAVVSSGNGPLLRVRVGPFAERAQALAKLRELETLGYRPFIAAAR